jgi:hypothetical protein
MIDFEKATSFYLGKIINPATEKTTDNLLLYESKNLTTHAVCVGMTGSGKTGLGIALLEEAGLDKIPAIIIDPKGDLTNLLLTFPNLTADEFLPWIDFSEAEKKSLTPEEYAESIAETWKEGLLASFEDGLRIKKLKDSVEMVIYTPASKAGVPISVLSSFNAPPANLRQDSELMRDKVLSLTSSLLGLLGIEADPINSKEHIMISAIIDQAWQRGENLDIASLIGQIQAPEFDKLGALNLEIFFPKKERLSLAVRLNGLLASKSFQAWMEGEPLDIEKLLYNDEKKPKLSILSIAHLSDTERMFFVTLVLGEFLTWMRRQPGTSSLKAILYMDEIFGYFPPSAMPPSKLPMLTLLKTARAFGIGIFLSTQNPVDLDYKGLSNCGTWFIGKLQTDRDKVRVLEGLRVASNGDINTETLDKMMSSIKKRTFIMRSIHEKDPIVFETRWTMSYLKGPLTLPQIENLTKKENVGVLNVQEINLKQTKPLSPQGIPEYFRKQSNFLKSNHYKPSVLGVAKLHFVDLKFQLDVWKTIFLLSPMDKTGKNIDLNNAEEVPDIKNELDAKPLPDSSFEDLPAFLMQEKNFVLFQKAFAATLYQNQSLKIMQLKDLGLLSKPDESETDFHERIKITLNQKQAETLRKLEEKYAEKRNVIENKLKRADEKFTIQKQQSWLQKIEAFISFVTTIFSAFLGKHLTKGTITQVGTSMRRAGRITKEDQQVVHAEDSLKSYESQLEDLKMQENEEIKLATTSFETMIGRIEEITVKPRKSDVTIDEVAIVWSPE